jgi:3-methyl-2-oxobutanoate hydroxymethyltransferase
VIHHCQAVRRGVREALLVADLPSGAYEASPAQAAASAIRLIKEGGASVVKLEGPSAGLAATISANGIPVMGHLGLPPISIHAPEHSFPAAVNLPSNQPQDRTERRVRARYP